MSALEKDKAWLDGQIKDFERSVAAGDIRTMARSIELLRNHWEHIDRDSQADILKLEAAFLSLVNIQTSRR